MKSGDSMKERGQYERVETVRKSGDSMKERGQYERVETV